MSFFAKRSVITSLGRNLAENESLATCRLTGRETVLTAELGCGVFVQLYQVSVKLTAMGKDSDFSSKPLACEATTESMIKTSFPVIT